MNKINYDKLTSITVKSQKELDDIPLNFKGQIYIEFGTYFEPAIVRNSYYISVVAYDNSSVEARENSSVVARENSSVEARENSSVVAYNNSSVEARENSSVRAKGNVQVVDRLEKGEILISGNARKVYMPKNIHEFMNFYGIEHTKTKATFYKAVRKENDKYYSEHDNNFTYEIRKIKTEKCDSDVNRSCSFGIHISTLDFALNFGKNWDNLAILEVETKIKDIVMPINADKKVRTSEVKVIREVSLSECGVFGKIIEKRQKNNVDT